MPKAGRTECWMTPVCLAPCVAAIPAGCRIAGRCSNALVQSSPHGQLCDPASYHGRFRARRACVALLIILTGKPSGHATCTMKNASHCVTTWPCSNAGGARCCWRPSGRPALHATWRFSAPMSYWPEALAVLVEMALKCSTAHPEDCDPRCGPTQPRRRLAAQTPGAG